MQYQIKNGQVELNLKNDVSREMQCKRIKMTRQ